MLTREIIMEKAREYGADLCGFGDVSLFAGTDPQRNPLCILPTAKSGLGFAFRTPRALYETAERGYQYANLTTMGVKVLDEEYSEIFLLKMARLIENEGYDACVQRRVSNLRIKGDHTQNPEVVDTYELSLAEAVAPGKPAPDVILDFAQAAEICGMGKAGRTGSVLTPRFGPFQRFVFIVTNLPFETYDAPFSQDLCDGCMECAKACKGNAIDEHGLDTWQCSVYYRGAHGSNPYMTDEILADEPDREAILRGEKRFDRESARAIYPKLDFLPSHLKGYSPCMCGKACDLACYRHLMARRAELQKECDKR